MNRDWLGGGEPAWLAGLTTSIRVHEEGLSRIRSSILVTGVTGRICNLRHRGAHHAVNHQPIGMVEKRAVQMS